MLLPGLADFATAFKTSPAQANRNQDEYAELHLSSVNWSLPNGACFASAVGFLYRIDDINPSLRLSMCETIELPELAKPEPQSSGILYKFARDGSKVEFSHQKSNAKRRLGYCSLSGR